MRGLIHFCYYSRQCSAGSKPTCGESAASSLKCGGTHRREHGRRVPGSGDGAAQLIVRHIQRPQVDKHITHGWKGTPAARKPDESCPLMCYCLLPFQGAQFTPKQRGGIRPRLCFRRKKVASCCEACKPWNKPNGRVRQFCRSLSQKLRNFPKQ